ncbi:MAG: hypothetical protein U0610_27120 [bacterium]|jgi:hypothetical protein
MLLLLAAFLPFLLIGFLLWYGLFRAGSTIADLLSPFIKSTAPA